MSETTEKDLGNKKETHCTVCGQPSFDTICDTCKAKIQGEALDSKHQVEKEGKTDTGRR
ncbi:MAG: hypothetical protein OEV28_10095 [Nitrospirota bacterium]|nr:hypothetical protein [Nitrospirota bacterium]